MALVCDVCLDHFDMNCHRPKCLPCGHTICSSCVLHPALGKKCPVCRKDLATDPNGFPDNILAIRMLEDGGAPHQDEAVGTDANLQQLQRGVEAGRKVVQLLRQVVPVAVDSLNNYMESTVTQLQQMEEALDRLQQQVAAGEESAPRRPVAVAVKQLQTVAHLEDSLRLLSASKVSVVVEEAEASWRATVQLGSFDSICRLLLVQLRADGRLQKEKADAAEAEPATPAAYIGPPKLSVLSFSDKDYDDEGDLELECILQDRRRWKNTRILQNLRGSNAEELLQALTPHLHIEELEHTETEAAPWVFDEVQKITTLKRLIVCCNPDMDDYPDLPLHLEELSITSPSESQLRCLQRMPRLRSLEVLHYFDSAISFPPSQHEGLLWLGVLFKSEYKVTMLSLIHAYASSLQELQIFCFHNETNNNYHFPNLGQDLAACGLQALRRLVLQRSHPQYLSGHADEACLLERQTIRSFLPTTVDVLCDICHSSVL